MGFEQLAALKAELAQKAAAEKAPQKRNVKTKGANGGNKAPVDPIIRIIGLLQKRFPKAFPKKPQPKVPLKIGIHKDLLAQTEALGVSANEIRTAMKKWCKGKRYADCMVAGAVRIDLDGNAVGFVSKEEAVQADTSRTGKPTEPQTDAN